jgi:zinc protease
MIFLLNRLFHKRETRLKITSNTILQRSLAFIAMTTLISVGAITLLAGSAQAGPRDRKTGVRDTTLANGITALIYEDKSDPLIAITVLYDVGSRDDPPGKTGLAKVCEWIMNNGSLGYWKGERERLLHAAGGSSSSLVWQDYSLYSSRFPKELVRKVMLIEADRMESPLVSRETVEAAKNSVMRERRIVRENNIYSALTSETLNQSYIKHPYRTDEYGSPEDLASIEPEDVSAFMRRFYQPANATVSIVGDFKSKNLFKEIDEIFSDIPTGPRPAHTYPAEPEQTAERRVSVSAALTVPVFIVSFHTPGVKEKDRLALEVLATMLVGGRSSFLYQKLVLDTGLCFTVGGTVAEFSDPSLLYCYAFLNRGVSFDAAESLLNINLRKAANGELSKADLTIARNQMEASFYGSWSGALGRSVNVARSYQVWGDGDYWEQRVKRIEKVSLADIQRVAKKYLTAENRVSIFLEPQGISNESGN